MKVLIVCNRLSFGGAERVAILWANGFVMRGHKVIIATNLFEPITYEVDKRVITCQLVSNNHNSIKKWLSSIVCLRKVVKKYKPDVVIGIMSTCSFISKVATIGNNISVISTEHDSFEKPVFPPLGRFRKFVMNRLYNDITVLSEADKTVIGNRLKNVFVMPNPLALTPIQDISKRPNTILAVGRIDAWYVKGFDVLIKSFAKLLNGSKVAEPRSKFKSNDIAFKIREEGWMLQIAGTGSEESLKYLKNLCKENGVEDSVEFLGFRKDVERLYQDASIFVLSSRYEGFGLVLIEAMSQGCACVACDYKGRQREIIAPLEEREQGSKFFLCDATKASQRAEHNVQSSNCKFEVCETGILCEPDNVNTLADAMAKMITDDEYRESVRKNAVERSKNYSIENTMNRWESLLKHVIGTR